MGTTTLPMDPHEIRYMRADTVMPMAVFFQSPFSAGDPGNRMPGS